MGTLEQVVIDRRATAFEEVGEAAARRSLRAQISRLERERSELIAAGFPHVSPIVAVAAPASAGPRLLSLEALEMLRDELAGALQDVRERVRARHSHEQEARELLERMRLEPGRYKFVRLPVRDLGQGGCGVWEVRPRLGLIGMLAGWWQLTLSSGCPLAGGPRRRRGPARAQVEEPRWLTGVSRRARRTLAARASSPTSPPARRLSQLRHARQLPRAGAPRACRAGASSSSRSSSVL